MADKTNFPSARELMHTLIVTMKEHRRLFDAMRERTGLGRSAHRMMMILSESENGCSQTQLAQILEISTAAVAVTLKKMETDGYITRTADPTDSRLNTTVLTDKGKRVVAESHTAFSKIDNALFDGFSKEEMYDFEGYIKRLYANIQKYEPRKDDEV